VLRVSDLAFTPGQPSERGINPGCVEKPHGVSMKDSSVKDGDASH